MASILETADINQLNGSFWSQTSTYSTAHLNECWALVTAWLDNLDFLEWDEADSTYIDASSLTALSQANEEGKYRGYLVPDFDAPLPLKLYVRVGYKGNRGTSYKNTVVIEACIRYGGVLTPWSRVYYTDNNGNQYTNNRLMGAPYVLYLSNDRKALAFAQGFFLSGPNSTANFPVGSHGMLIEYSDEDDALYGDMIYCDTALSKYVLQTYNTMSESGKHGRHQSFKIAGGVMSGYRQNYLPAAANLAARVHTNTHNYSYKNFIAVIEPGEALNGMRVTIDGVVGNYAPINMGYTLGSTLMNGRTSGKYVISDGYWYYPIGACCLYALVD